MEPGLRFVSEKEPSKLKNSPAHVTTCTTHIAYIRKTITEETIDHGGSYDADSVPSQTE